MHGHDNDVVRIFIDGHEVMRGGSWENYYRFYEERNPDPSDRLIIRTSGTAAPASLGGGFLFDDVTSRSYHVDNPAPLDPVVLPQGAKGDTGATGSTGASGAKGTDGTNGSNGTNGVNGEDGAAGSAGKDGVNGVTTIIRDYGKVSGARMRTVYAPKSKGKFVAVARSCAVSPCRLPGGRSRSISAASRLATTSCAWSPSTRRAARRTRSAGIRSLNIVRK